MWWRSVVASVPTRNQSINATHIFHSICAQEQRSARGAEYAEMLRSALQLRLIRGPRGVLIQQGTTVYSQGD